MITAILLIVSMGLAYTQGYEPIQFVKTGQVHPIKSSSDSLQLHADYLYVGVLPIVDHTHVADTSILWVKQVQTGISYYIGKLYGERNGVVEHVRMYPVNSWPDSLPSAEILVQIELTDVSIEYGKKNHLPEYFYGMDIHENFHVTEVAREETEITAVIGAVTTVYDATSCQQFSSFFERAKFTTSHSYLNIRGNKDLLPHSRKNLLHYVAPKSADHALFGSLHKLIPQIYYRVYSSFFRRLIEKREYLANINRSP